MTLDTFRAMTLEELNDWIAATHERLLTLRAWSALVEPELRVAYGVLKEKMAKGTEGVVR